MRIEEIDRRFRSETAIQEDITWFDVRQAPFSLFGIQYDEGQGCFVRLPQAVADAVSPGVSWLNRHTAGGRVCFQTDSPLIAIEAQLDYPGIMPHMPLAGQSGFDLYRNSGEGDRYLATFMPPPAWQDSYGASARTGGGPAAYTVHFPLYNGVKALYIAIQKGASLAAAHPYVDAPPIVFYGSSITQGGCASRPGNSYEAILSRRLHRDHVNLGFSGSCRAEPAMADYLAALPMSAFVCDYDHNAPHAEHLRQTHLPLYRAVRRGHADIPIVFMSAPDIRLRGGEWEERRAIIRATYQEALAEGDRRVWFVDGETLFAGEEWDACTVDGCHPNDLGFFRMAMGVEGALRTALQATGA